MTDDELIREIDARYSTDPWVSTLAVRFADAVESLKAVEEFEEYNRVDFVDDADIIQRYQNFGEELEGWIEILADVDPDPEAEQSALDYLRGIVDRYKNARIWVCQDCLVAIANDDYSGLSNERAADIRSAIAQYRVLAPGDGELDFSTRPCECCADHRHGSRHAVMIVDEVP
jgi:hypothetical protein